MKKNVVFTFLLFVAVPLCAQQVLTLDSCRNMAIRNNKQLRIANEKIKAAGYEKKAAFANYLPNLDFTGTYLFNQKNLSLLAEDALLPTKTFDLASQSYQYNVVKNPVTQQPILVNGKPIPETVALIPKEAFEFDIKNTWGGIVTLTQPLFMGGKIMAYNKITEFAEELARTQKNTAVKDVVFRIDEAYWQVVSLQYKKKLAESYVDLLEKLNGNVEAMEKQGVATKSDVLTVAVKLNEAQMTLTKVDDGVRLSKMLLAQLCGMPIDTPYQLYDENVPAETVHTADAVVNMEQVYATRTEIKSLELATKIFQKKQTVVASAMFPQLAVTGNYVFTNPNAFNGFENKFSGMFNVGVVLRVPLCHWGENINKLKAAKAQTHITKLELDEVKEKIELQVNQAVFKINEASKKVEMTRKNMEKADENLRNAQIGFAEGVLTTNNVLEAQTAWLQAQSEKIDADIDARLCEVYLSKAMGTMQVNNK